MNPILFDENATTFTTNGIGRLSDAISCKVTEERNGQYELEMIYPESGNFASDITLNAIIGVIPCDGTSMQPFRVYCITKPINGQFSIYAQHISYQLSLIPAMPFNITASSSACNNTLQALKTNAVGNCPFTFWTDVTTVASYQQIIPASIRSRLGGSVGSVLDQFGGEFEWDNYTVKLHAHRGVQTPSVWLKYGKNITDLNQEQNIAETVTSIVPFWADSEGGNVVTLTEKVIDGAHASDYPFKRVAVVDFSGDFEEKPTENQLRTHTQAFINKNNIGVPKVSIEVSFVHLRDTEEYKDVAPLQTVKLCDEVGIVFEKYGINTSAKVIKTVYDVLAERYDSIELGEARSSLANTITLTDASVSQLADATKTNFAKASNETDAKIDEALDDIADTYSTKQYVQTVVDNATAWLTGSDGVVRAIKNANGDWTDLLFMSTTATASTGNVLRLNTNGVGFSSTGWNGPFTQAWTLDGKLVIGGTNVPSITVYDNSNQIIFHADATKIKWNALNSSLSDSGVLTANGATLNNALINGGDLQITGNGGWLRLYQGRIYAGQGNTVGQNQSYVSGNYPISVGGSTQNGNLAVNTNYFCIDSNGISVTNQRNGSGAVGYTGNVAVPMTIQYVEDPTDLQVGDGNYTTYTNIVRNMQYYDSGGFLHITSFDSFDLTVPNYWDINGTYRTLTQGYLQTRHGVVVGDVTPVTTTCRLKFNKNGGSGSVPATITFNNPTEDSYDITSTVPTRSGYTFRGWSASRQWSTHRFAYSANAGATEASDGTTATVTGSSWTFARYYEEATGQTYDGTVFTLTVYAQWDNGTTNDDEIIIEEGE